jgi:Leu/Phe-tRNA-protein transferase
MLQDLLKECPQQMKKDEGVWLSSELLERMRKFLSQGKTHEVLEGLVKEWHQGWG